MRLDEDEETMRDRDNQSSLSWSQSLSLRPHRVSLSLRPHCLIVSIFIASCVSHHYITSQNELLQLIALEKDREIEMKIVIEMNTEIDIQLSLRSHCLLCISSLYNIAEWTSSINSIKRDNRDEVDEDKRDSMIEETMRTKKQRIIS